MQQLCKRTLPKISKTTTTNHFTKYITPNLHKSVDLTQNRIDDIQTPLLTNNVFVLP